MTDNPYINKQNWGRDLLDRLNNFSDDDGSFNVWDELPTTGKDGSILGEEHKGLTGILKAEQTSIYLWNGIEWEELARIPISFDGTPLTINEIERTGSIVAVLNPSNSTPFFFVVSYVIGDANFSVEKVLKSNCSIEWSISIATAYGTDTTGFSVYHANKTYNSWLFHNDRLFLNIYYNSVGGVKQKFYCIHSNGYTAWTSPYEFTNNMRNCLVFPGLSQDVYFVGQTSIIRLNANNGELLNTGTIPLTYYAYAKCVSSLNKIVFVQATTDAIGNAKILLINLDLQGTHAEILTNTLSSFIYWFVPDPRDDTKYYFRELISNTTRIWLFKATNQSFSVIQDSPIQVPGIVDSVRIDENGICSIAAINGLSVGVYEFSADNNSIPLRFVKTFVPGGDGNVQSTLNYDFISSESILLQIPNLTVTGYANSYRVTTKIIASPSGRQVVYFKESTFLPTGNFANILKQSTFNSLYATSIQSPEANFSSLYISNFSSGSDKYFLQNLGLNIGVGLILASCFGDSQQLNSIGYTGTNRGQAVSGLFFNCGPILGNLVNHYSYRSAGSGVFLFDQRLSKFFWEVKPTQAQEILTSFPSANGVCLTNNNFLGVGSENPAFKVDVVGILRATEIRNSGGVITSDPRLKTNMTSLNGEELWEVCQLLNPITFVYKPDFEVEIQEITKDEEGKDVVNTSKSRWPLPQGIQYGYNALEVEELLPELVDEDPQGIKYLNNGALFPIFQAAATSKIQSLESEVETLKQLVQSLVARIEVLENA